MSCNIDAFYHNDTCTCTCNYPVFLIIEQCLPDMRKFAIKMRAMLSLS